MEINGLYNERNNSAHVPNTRHYASASFKVRFAME